MKLPDIKQDVLTGRFVAWSVDPNAPHCYGSGDTEETALMSYKLSYRAQQRRRQ